MAWWALSVNTMTHIERGNPWRQLPAGPLIAPSLLACDFARAGEQIDAVLAAGADLLHVDIMDGHFVPNLSMGPEIVKSLRNYTDAPLDVHIMVTDPAYYIEKFADAGADSITFHMEDALAVARIAGISAAKKPWGLIPLCHNIEIEHVDVNFRFVSDGIEIECSTVCTDKTGIEMEALTAVSVAALTIYDMCKAVDKEMVIKEIILVEKRKEEKGQEMKAE